MVINSGRILKLFPGPLSVLGLILLNSSCESETFEKPLPDHTNDTVQIVEFPPFITPIGKYFDLSIQSAPDIDSETYQLEVSGALNNPDTFSLDDLRNMKMVEKTLTIECIENPANGSLLATATWKGFQIYSLLDSLGLKDNVSTVKYTCADGYYTYNTIEELQSSDVIGALYMNDWPIPSKFGFPLRILFPGYYGVRQPGWVVRIEVLETGPEDYWAQYGWETDAAMSIDSKIFFPKKGEKFALGDTLKVGGTAYGSERISSIDVTIDGGLSWIPAEIVQDLDQDYVWVFWEATVVPQSEGTITIFARATAHDGSKQPYTDVLYVDGTNAWPSVQISVIRSN